MLLYIYILLVDSLFYFLILSCNIYYSFGGFQIKCELIIAHDLMVSD